MQLGRLGFSNIAQRLRAVLLTIAVLVIAQPILVYFTTNRIIAAQEAVSEELIETTFRTARLNREVGRIAAEGRSLQAQTDAEKLRNISASIIKDIDALGIEFAVPQQEGSTSSQQLVTELDAYKSLIASETEATAQQLDAENRLAKQVFEIRRISGDMLAILGREIAAHKIELDRRIAVLELSDKAQTVPQLRETFNNLITLNSIADAISAERLFIAAIEQSFRQQLPQTRRGRLHLQIANLATQIAKLRAGETQTGLAKQAIAMNSSLFGDDGVFAQIEQYDTAAAQAAGIVEEQQVLAAALLDTSQALVAEAQAEVVASSTAAAKQLNRIRAYMVVISALVALLVIAAIMFVVERQFNRRISRLTERVIAIAKGQKDTGETLAGNDELSAMSDALVVFKRNASELRGANETLAQRNDEVKQLSGRLETILDTTTSGIIAFDDVGQIILANRPARHFLGGISKEAPFERPEGLKFLNREDLSPLDASSDPINRVIAGQTLNNEIALLERAGGGDGRYVRITSNRVKNPDSLVRSVLAIDDVSVAEQNRQQIERASRLDALGQLTGGIAHDFNNLLATIQYAVQLSADATEQPSRERFTKIALDSVDRGSKLSGRLLTFAKRQPGISKSNSIEKTLEDFKSLVEPTLEKFITLEFKVDEPDMSVFCDGAQLENALLNLVLNARDAIVKSGSGDKISIGVRGVAEISSMGAPTQSEPDRYMTNSLEAELRNQADQHGGAAYRYVEFSVTDNGPGMTADVKRRALDPFFTTKSTNSGTGLGLSMVYGFVQQSGGELRIYSEVDRGTTMRLLLPRGSNANKREAPVSRQSPLKGAGQKILIVEDEAHLLEAMEALVDSLGYNICKATSGADALEMIRDGIDIDLMLTDIVMPGGIGGFDLAAKARELRPDLPIIYMSGYAAYSVKEMGVVVARLLQKPCAPSDLAEALQSALTQPPQV